MDTHWAGSLWQLGGRWMLLAVFSVAVGAAVPVPVGPKRAAAPVLDLHSKLNQAKVVACLERGLTGLKIPPGFVHKSLRSDGGVSVMLADSASGRKGPIIDVSPQGRGSWVRLYANGMVLSSQWHAMVRRCSA